MEFIGDKLSLNIYILHVPVFGIIKIILQNSFGLDVHGTIYLWCRPIIAFLAAAFVSWVIYIAAGRIKARLNQ